jgi:preprotein translocase subunit SecG
MGFIIGLLYFVLILACFMLILLVLVQSGSGGGLASAFGGGGEESLLGGRGSQTLQQWTKGAAIAFFLSCCMIAYFESHRSTDLTQDLESVEPDALDVKEKAGGSAEENEETAPEGKGETGGDEGGGIGGKLFPGGSGLEGGGGLKLAPSPTNKDELDETGEPKEQTQTPPVEEKEAPDEAAKDAPAEGAGDTEKPAEEPAKK